MMFRITEHYIVWYKSLPLLYRS